MRPVAAAAAAAIAAVVGKLLEAMIVTGMVLSEAVELRVRVYLIGSINGIECGADRFGTFEIK